MSDTTGWKRNEDGLEKCINGDIFEIWRNGANRYQLRRYGAFCTTRPTLRECQQLAHATARLWAGDNE